MDITIYTFSSIRGVLVSVRLESKLISLSDGRVDGMRIAQRLAKRIGTEVHFDDLDT